MKIIIIIIFSILILILNPFVYGYKSVVLETASTGCGEDGKIGLYIKIIQGSIGTSSIKITAKEKEPAGRVINITGIWNKKILSENDGPSVYPPSIYPTASFTSNIFFNKTYPTSYDLTIIYPYYLDNEKKYENITYSVECPAFEFSCDLVFFESGKCRQEGNNTFISFNVRGFDQPKKIDLLTDFDYEINGEKSMVDSLPDDAELIKDGKFPEIRFTFKDKIDLIKLRAINRKCDIPDKIIYKCEQINISSEPKCTKNEDCTDKEYCNLSNKECSQIVLGECERIENHTNIKIKGCCISNIDCKDSLVCTEDSCLNNTCLNNNRICQSEDKCLEGKCIEPAGCVFDKKEECLSIFSKISRWFKRLFGK